ncbi:hypothetical protein DFH28DRAFT_934613 [Melampsora americana]|nr:hypothetical protein DFH28DRAFT_934613 [Melampsora americana]
MPVFSTLNLTSPYFINQGFLNHIYGQFNLYTEPTTLVILPTGQSMVMHWWKDFLFQIRGFGTEEADCVAFRLESVLVSPPADHVVLFNFETKSEVTSSRIKPVTLAVAKREIFTKRDLINSICPKLV